MLEVIQEELNVRKQSAKNIKMALTALLLFVLSGVSFFLDVEFFFETNYTIFLVLLIFYYGFMLLSFVLAILSGVRSLKLLMGTRSYKNYLAIMISAIVIFGCISEVIERITNGY